MTTKHWVLAFVFALVAHGTIAAVFLMASTKQDVIELSAGEGLSVNLGMASFSESPVVQEKHQEKKHEVKKAKVEKIVKKVKPKEKAVKAKAKLEPKKEPVKKPEKEFKQRVVADSQITGKQAVSAEQSSSTEQASIDKPVENSAQQEQLQMASASQTSSSANNQSNKDSSANAGISPEDAMGIYAALLSQKIKKHKKYPLDARKSKQEGVVQVRVSIARSGQIISKKVIRSSGHERLDIEALETLERSNPLPKIPMNIDRDPLVIVLPIQYALRS